MTVGYQDGRIVPYEVLVEIFSHLSFSDVLSAGLVCRLWHDVSCHVLRHSRTVCLEGGGAERAAGLLASEEAAPFTRLVLREADVSARGPLAGLWSSAGPGLSVLRLLGCTVKESDLVQILSHCEELEELALVGCDSLFMTGNILSRDSAQQLSLPSLRRLDLSANRYLSDAILQRLLALAPGLEELSLRSCEIGFHPGIFRKFYPGGGAGAVSSSVLTFECVMAFVRERAAAVRALDLSDTNVEDGALADLAAVSELRLETLRLEGCRAATGAGLAALLTAQPRLAELDLSGTRADAATTAAAAQLPRLRRLALRRCDRLPAAALEPLAGAALHELDLSENERLPADAAAAALPADGSQLRRLRLRALKLTADCVIRLAGRLSALRELDLSRCLTGVTDSSLQAICRHLPGLEVLRLSECHLVTDSGLTGLGLAGAGPDPAAPLKPNKTFLHGEAGAAQEPAEQPPPSALVTPPAQSARHFTAQPARARDMERRRPKAAGPESDRAQRHWLRHQSAGPEGSGGARPVPVQSCQRYRGDPRGASRGSAPTQPGALPAAGGRCCGSAGQTLPGARVGPPGRLRVTHRPRADRTGAARPPPQTPGRTGLYRADGRLCARADDPWR